MNFTIGLEVGLIIGIVFGAAVALSVIGLLLKKAVIG